MRKAYQQGKYWEPYFFYGCSFLFFALMNMSAIVYHCTHPPPLYIALLPQTKFPSWPVLTHIAHVGDICSTGCSCLSFVIGRLYHLKILKGKHISPGVFMTCFALIFLVGAAGLQRAGGGESSVIPYLGELLYLGVMGATGAIAPLLRWPRHKVGFAVKLSWLTPSTPTLSHMPGSVRCVPFSAAPIYDSLWIDTDRSLRCGSPGAAAVRFVWPTLHHGANHFRDVWPVVRLAGAAARHPAVC